MGARASRLRFCSIADARYLAQVIVMHRSLREVLPEARTEVLCMDGSAHRALEAVGAPGLLPVAIGELEERDPALASVRPGRSRHEYAQTAKPAFCLDVMTRSAGVDWVTYVDADSMFFAHPGPVFDELTGFSIGLLGHRFAPRFRARERWASPYIPSWVSFACDAGGTEAVRWWRERCLEWCFHRVEGDRHSDQGYLRDWPQRFEGVHVIGHPGLGPAPWTENSGLARHGDSIVIDGEPLILFHYQSLRVHRRRRGIDLSRSLMEEPIPLSWRIYRGYRVGAREQELVWQPYLNRLAAALRELHSIDPALLDELRPPGIRQMGRDLVRHVWMTRHDVAVALRRGDARVGGRAAAPG